MRIDNFKPVTLVFFLLFTGVLCQMATAQFLQKGQKIDPFFIDLDIGAEFGTALSLSNDGNTAIIGAPYDKDDVGAAFIYTLTSCGWEMTKKLVGSGGVQGTLQGYSVDISADGNTAIIGAPKDNGGVGAAWIFAKSGGTWAQVKKLTPADASGQSEFGTSVAISADGNTVIVGGAGDNNGLGASWIFKRSGNWAQAMNKLLGSDIKGTYANTFAAKQGRSVDISADGSIAVVGAPGHNTGGRGSVNIYAIAAASYSEQDYFFGTSPNVTLGYAVAISNDGNTIIAGTPRTDGFNGGVVVLVRLAGTWQVQQGVQLSSPSKLHQGMSVALSADGNTAIIGGGGTSVTHNSSTFNSPTIGTGASWVMTRTGSTWTEQGKFVGFPSSGNCQQGSAVAISGNGKSFLTAGFADNNNDGAAWYFTTEAITIPVPSISDFNPKTATEPQTVTITGTNFTCVTDVSFGNVFGDILSQTATTITARVNGNASDSSGDVCVYALGGTDCMAGFTYSGTSPTAIAQVTSVENRIQLYPNPASAELMLQLPMPASAEGQVAIFDPLGRQVYQQQVGSGTETLRVDISALAAGIYTLHLSHQDKIHHLTFIKH